jgi:hypothetical protein
MGAVRNAYRNLARNLEWKRSFRRSRNRQKANIKMDLIEIGLDSVDWIHLAQYRDKRKVLFNKVMKLWVP